MPKASKVPGNPRAVLLCANKSAVKIMLGDLIRKAEQAKVGITDPYEKHTRRPLAEHLADFLRKMEAENDEPRHVAIVGTRLRSLLDGCHGHGHINDRGCQLLARCTDLCN